MMEGAVTKWAAEQAGFATVEDMFRHRQPDDGTVGRQLFARMQTLVLQIHAAEGSRKSRLMQLQRAVDAALRMTGAGQRMFGGLVATAQEVERYEDKVNSLVEQYGMWLEMWSVNGGPADDADVDNAAIDDMLLK